jgi:hypothetical protein
MGRSKKKHRAIPGTDDEQWDQWQADIKRIYNETVYAFKNRLIYREVRRIMMENPVIQAEGGYFHNWMMGVYGRDQAIAVRRELDDSVDAINLIRLMQQMVARPNVMSRERYQRHFSPDSAIPVEMQAGQFAKIAGHPDYISRQTINEDRKTLINACAPVVLYASKMIAHRTEQEPSLTIAQIDTALDAIEATFQKYYLLLTGNSLMQAEPAVQFDWQTIFTIPWVVPVAAP